MTGWARIAFAYYRAKVVGWLAFRVRGARPGRTGGLRQTTRIRRLPERGLSRPGDGMA